MFAQAVEQGSSGQKIELVIHIEGKLCDTRATKNGVRYLRDLLRIWPASYTLEQGKGGGLHFHVLTVAEAALGLPSGIYSTPIDDLFGRLCYLSKPRNALAAKSEHFWPSLDDKYAATEFYFEAGLTRKAEGYKRRPMLTGYLNMKRQKKPRPLPVPVSAKVSPEIQAARLARWKAVLAARRARRPFAPKTQRRHVMAPFWAAVDPSGPPSGCPPCRQR
jgi:hypothetical protein